MKQPHFFLKFNSSLGRVPSQSKKALLVLCCLFVLAHVKIQAADYTWDAGGGDTNWTTAANWDGDVVPPSDGTHTINISGTLPANVSSNIDTPFNIQRMVFDTASLVTLDGSTLTFRGTAGAGHDGDIMVDNKTSSLKTININIDMAKGGVIRGGTMIINGNIASNGTIVTQNGLRFTSGNITVNGIISSADNGDSVAVNGATVTLNNVNTFTRGFTVWSGVARAGVDSLHNENGAFGKSTAALNVGHAGTGGASVLAANAIEIGRNITLNASGSSGFVAYTLGGDTAHTSVFSGTITNGNKTTTTGVGDNFNAMAMRLTAASGGRVNFTGNIVRAGTATGSVDNVEKLGAGTVAINGATNNWEGNTTVSAGFFYVNGTLQTNTSGKGITVASSATFGGRGTASRSVSLASGAILAAGDPTTNNGIGRLTIGYSLGTALTLNSAGGSILNFQVTSTSDVNSINRFANLNDDGSLNWTAVLAATPSSAINNDTLILQGNLVENSAGTLTTINFSLAGGGTLYSGMVWDIMDWQTVNGANGPLTQSRYNFVVDPTLAAQLSGAGLALDTSRFWDTGYVGITPEPGRAMLFGMGVMAMLMRRSRRK